MIAQDYRTKSSDLDRKLDLLYPDQELIYDGILDIERYSKSKYKIMWILKEPYDYFDDDGNPSGGGWHFSDALIPKEKIEDFDRFSRKTYEPIIYATYSILNGFPDSTAMDLISDNPTMIEALKSIAYINIKKTPGLTKTSDAVLYSAYKKNWEILDQQIEMADPDIIIFGNTYKYFSYNSKLVTNPLRKYDQFSYTTLKNRILISAFHPAQMSYSKWDYINELIFICKEELQNMNIK